MKRERAIVCSKAEGRESMVWGGGWQVQGKKTKITIQNMHPCSAVTKQSEVSRDSD